MVFSPKDLCSLIREVDIIRNTYVAINRNSADKNFRDDCEDEFSFQSPWRLISDIPAAYKRAIAKEAREAKKTKFAWHPKYGYLSPNPNLCGTLMKIQGEFHLVGLKILGDLNATLSGLAAMRIGCESITEDGGRNDALIYHVQNVGMLGITEEDLIKKIQFAFSELLHQEMNARKKLIVQYPRILGDAISRSLATLTSARLIIPFEIVHHLSPLLLAATLGLLDGITKETVVAFIENYRNIRIEEPETSEEDFMLAKQSATLADNINKYFKRIRLSKLARDLFL